tara:strand:+ start:2444 stop:2725 length:282 start_codon:yes stop_codon:yes gene_type:complete
MPDAISNNTPLDFNSWLRSQGSGAGSIFPNTPQGGDYWQEAYNDYLAGWEHKFGQSTPEPSPPGQGVPSPNFGMKQGGSSLWDSFMKPKKRSY